MGTRPGSADTDPRDDEGLLQALFSVRRDEQLPLAFAFAYFFCVLAAYYVLRPIRDEMGVTGGVNHLPWLFLGTLLTTLIVSPLFSKLVARLPRRRFVTWAYRGLILCLVVFAAAMVYAPASVQTWIGRMFFVWTSVFAVFAVSLFWAVMADVFQTTQARRLYGVIGAGGTLGGIAGGLLTGWLVQLFGHVPLLFVSALLLEAGLRAMYALSRHVAARGETQARIEQEIIGGNAWAGVSGVLRSPYLIAIALFMLLFTVGSAFLYFLQAEIVAREIADRAARTAYFARVDVWVNGLTLIVQLVLTGRLIDKVGVGAVLVLLPLLSLVGFLALAAAPLLSLVVLLQVLRRTGDFALSRPAREVLYVPLSREEKYKAKNFVDTFVFRFGDQLGAWTYTALAALGLSLAGIAAAAVPLSAAWLAVALWLGRRHARLAPQRPGGTIAATLLVNAGARP
ncbi:MAG: MFS transporter [Rhodanobacteraceae bacterium]|nr:MFS transporter [Rhodanobacteraceae bacterium]